MICDALEHLNRYRGLHRNLDTAIDYLTAYHVAHDLSDLPLGRYRGGRRERLHQRDGGRFEPPTAPASNTTKSNADLQIDLTGGEGWGYTTLPGEEAWEFTGDIGFRTSPDAVSGTLGEGRFVLFFPGELHKPGVARPGCAHVRKVVIKIRMED